MTCANLLLTWAAELWLASGTSCGTAPPSGSPDLRHAGRSCPYAYIPGVQQKADTVNRTFNSVHLACAFVETISIVLNLLYTHRNILKDGQENIRDTVQIMHIFSNSKICSQLKIKYFSFSQMFKPRFPWPNTEHTISTSYRPQGLETRMLIISDSSQ